MIILSVLLKVIAAPVMLVAAAAVAQATPLKANSEMSMTTRIRNRLKLCVWCLFPMQCLQEVSFNVQLWYRCCSDANAGERCVWE